MSGTEKFGVVVSDKMQKTITVQVETRAPHPLYGKLIKKRAKFYAHDEREEAAVGDTVRIVQVRPLSRLKRWRLAEVVKKKA
jgi:small subunit ribosomal protein S17